MKTALIQCPAWGRQNPPLALAMLSAFLRSKGKEVYLFDLNNKLFHSVTEEDKRLWQLGSESFWDNKKSIADFSLRHKEPLDGFVKDILDTGAGVIGFSTYSSSKEFSLFIAQKIKDIDRSKIIIFGGPHSAPHMHGRQIIDEESIDLIAIGEGEITLNEVVDSIIRNGKPDYCKGIWLKKCGKVVDCGERELIGDLNELPFADFEDFPLDSYAEPSRLPIYFSRGCVNRCVYCNENLFWKGYRSRSGRRVFEEVKYQLSRHKGVRHFDFTDSLVNANIKELSLFADLVIREGFEISWGGQALIRPYMIPEVLEKLKQSGCVCLAYGMESGSQKVLDFMRKGFKVEDASRVIRDTHEAGIDTVANFMFGFPGETEEDFAQTLEFVSSNRTYIDTVNPSLGFTAIGEGTYLYEHAKDYNIDLRSGYLFWRDIEGKNTYEVRKDRYNTFCKLASSLGIKFSYPVDINNNAKS